MEEKVIRPWYHRHPLILKENVSKEERVDCYGCRKPVGDLEMAYVCMELDCSFRNRRIILHKKCGEVPGQIRHPKHPNHPIHLCDFHQLMDHRCDVCRRNLDKVLGYRCSSCDFNVDIACEKIGIDVALLEDRKELKHPSHLDHPLTLMRKLPAFPFYCDGCGAQDVDMAYICSTCEFMVHESCASSPLIRVCHHHHHPLSLAFSFPKEHLKYDYTCEVCDTLFDRTCWVYFCGDCRYFVHIKCVGSATKPDSNLIEDDDDDGGSNVIKFPLHVNDIANKLITPFVTRGRGVDTTSNSVSFKYHDHPLSLVWEAAADDELKICDVCITPISSPPYYECASCKYLIHSICCFLPSTLNSSSSSPNSQLYNYEEILLYDYLEIPNKNHNFTLYATSNSHLVHLFAGCQNHNFTIYEISKSKDMDAFSHWRHCSLCYLPTNGMGYKCEKCWVEVDVKCASLPTTITHASHPHHNKPLLLTRIPLEKDKFCRGCDSRISISGYCCSKCDFALDVRCALLPKSIREREWDKHPLLLTFDASLDHPSDFFCEFCEQQMHPKKWMYHCRQYDASFHLSCLRNASGVFRNIKIGGRYKLDGIHPNHPLTFNYITLKRRCHLCHNDVYTWLGFECASCYYVVCGNCGLGELEKI